MTLDLLGYILVMTGLAKSTRGGGRVRWQSEWRQGEMAGWRRKVGEKEK